MAQLAPLNQQFFKASGAVNAGGLVYTYEAQSTTPKATYTDKAAGTANANPVVLDSGGFGNIWLLSGGYKFIIKDSAGSTIDTIDDIYVYDGTIFGLTSTNQVQIKIPNNTTNAFVVYEGAVGGVDYININTTTGNESMSLDSEGTLLLNYSANGNVAIGAVSDPDKILEVRSNSEQIRLSFDDTESTMLYSDTDGEFRVTPTGGHVYLDLSADGGGYLDITGQGLYHIKMNYFGSTNATLATDSSGFFNITTTGGKIATASTVESSGGLVTKVSTADVADPPTDANLDSAFGTPANLGAGFIGIVDDASGDANVYICYTSDTSWYYIKGTKAT